MPKISEYPMKVEAVETTDSLSTQNTDIKSTDSSVERKEGPAEKS